MKPKETYSTGFPIRPLSVIQLVKIYRDDFSKLNLNHFCRIGFYSKSDGLDVIWLVDHSGQYAETINHEFLHKKFLIIQNSDIYDYHGIASDVMEAITNPSSEWIWNS